MTLPLTPRSSEVDEPLLSTAALAAKLLTHPDTITRSWVPKGCPFELRLPRGYRFRLSKVEAWLDARAGRKTASDETVTELTAKMTTAFAALEARRRQGRAS